MMLQAEEARVGKFVPQKQCLKIYLYILFYFFTKKSISWAFPVNIVKRVKKIHQAFQEKFLARSV